MTAIGLILAIKISITSLLIGGPFLFMPEERLAKMTGVTGGSSIFRLYGVAILALLAGYTSGFWTIAEGHFPWGVAAMGMVSNGGATLVLLTSGAWQRKPASTSFVAAVTLALVAASLNSSYALVPLW
jgi:hypothetical protein